MDFLIVDDSNDPLQKMRKIITEMGHQVVGIAYDGEEGLEIFRDKHPDVVIMDLIMPRMNGIEALRSIRAMHPEAVVVMTSAIHSPDTLIELEATGARHFLKKPFNESTVRTLIDTLSREHKPSA